jgi:hypothetical protein
VSRGLDPPGRLGLGEPRVAAAATYSGGGAGYVDGMDAPGGRGAHRDGGHDRRARAWPFDASQSAKGEDDNDDASVTRGGSHLAVGGGRRAVGGWRGR